jgi:anti-anti-sigma regulatory factor
MANPNRVGAPLQTPSTTDLELMGDVRADQVARLHHQISALNQAQQPSLNIDCAQLTSLDGAIFQLLTFWRGEYARSGRKLILNNLNPPIAELLQSSGFSFN